jgi:hypothetical protein
VGVGDILVRIGILRRGKPPSCMATETTEVQRTSVWAIRRTLLRTSRLCVGRRNQERSQKASHGRSLRSSSRISGTFDCGSCRTVADCGCAGASWSFCCKFARQMWPRRQTRQQVDVEMASAVQSIDGAVWVQSVRRAAGVSTAGRRDQQAGGA